MMSIFKRYLTPCLQKVHTSRNLASLVLLALPYIAFGDIVPPLSGWTHGNALARDTSDKHGVILAGNDVGLANPVIADIDGNTSNGKELVAVSANGTVNAINASGALMWSAKLPTRSCSKTGFTKASSTPAVGALYGDGVPYVVVGYGGGRSCGGGVVALRGSNGAQKWNLDLKKFAKKEKFYSFSPTVFSSPALADTDGDGKLEIGFGAFDRAVYLVNYDGTVRWYYHAADTVWSSPSFADINNDGKLEMIIGTDITQNLRLKPITKNGGILYAMKTAKRSKKKIAFRDPTAFVWKTEFDQVLYASPVVAEVMPSNPGLEVIIGSGCFFPERKNNKNGKWFKVVSASTGKVLKTLTTTACSSSKVGIGDLDKDGINDVVATVSGSKSIGGDGRGHLVAWRGGDFAKLWDIVPYYKGRNDTSLGYFRSPQVADLKGDGNLKVVFSNGRGVSIVDGATSEMLTCATTSCSDGKPELLAWDVLQNSPVVDDINNDGKLDVFAGGGHVASNNRGVVYGWSDFATHLP